MAMLETEIEWPFILLKSANEFIDSGHADNRQCVPSLDGWLRVTAVYLQRYHGDVHAIAYTDSAPR